MPRDSDSSISNPTRDAKVVKKWKDKIDDFEVTVVSYSDYEKFEYWECEECYTED